MRMMSTQKIKDKLIETEKENGDMKNLIRRYLELFHKPYWNGKEYAEMFDIIEKLRVYIE